jgi:hypothetical protein
MDLKYQVMRNALTLETCKLIKDTLEITKNATYWSNNVPLSDTRRFGDNQTPDSYVNYGHSVTEALLLTIQPFVENFTNKKLYPTYSYSRIYYNGAVLEKHTDRPSCQYSATVCIDNDPEPWAIFMGGNEVMLEPGDIVCYKGCEIEHWRERYQGRQQIQVFLHYVDQQGEYADFKFDGRPMLGLSR